MDSKPPQRWVDQAQTPAETEAAKLVRAIGPAARLSESALERAQERLRAAVVAPNGSRWIKPTIVGSLMLVVAGLLWLKPETDPAPPPVAVIAAPAIPEVGTTQEPQPAPAPTPSIEAPTRKQPSAPRLSVAAAQAQPASRLLEESRLLGLAVQQLRKQRDPTGALATLGSYFARFPDGSLLHEAQAVRVDALLGLDRKADALQVLEVLAASDFSGLPRSPELRVIRAELLASAGRDPEAARAFDVALSSDNAVHDLEERALFGRASCRARLGDKAHSSEDLARYLKSYPQGRFAVAARAALEANAAP